MKFMESSFALRRVMKKLIRNAGKQEEGASTFPAFLLSLLVLPWAVMLLPTEAADNRSGKEESSRFGGERGVSTPR
jgi:hypothetical protein